MRGEEQGKRERKWELEGEGVGGGERGDGRGERGEKRMNDRDFQLNSVPPAFP